MKKPAIPASSKPKEEKQAPVPDPRFPNARQAWGLKRKLYYWMRSMASRMMILVSIFSGFPKTGETPFSVACKIASQRHLTNGWKEQFREVSDKIRLSGLSISEY
jgi:hypothetical protein